MADKTSRNEAGVQLAFEDWIIEVEREMNMEEPLSPTGRKEFEKYFKGGYTPSAAIYEDRQRAGV